MATTERYIEAIGRRKTAIARVRVTPSKESSWKVNGLSLQDYFRLAEFIRVAQEALTSLSAVRPYTITVQVKGGGLHSQAEAIRHGLSRALVEDHEEVRPELKKAGFLKRDPRSKERRKFGLRKARKAPQWSKR
jgi:small subunit ribosomal protein S9